MRREISDVRIFRAKPETKLEMCAYTWWFNYLTEMKVQKGRDMFIVVARWLNYDELNEGSETELNTKYAGTPLHEKLSRWLEGHAIAL